VEAAFSKLRPNLALHYPFELDTFQKEAVVHLENNNSVGVVAAMFIFESFMAVQAISNRRQHV